jgi:hypothetical protein
MLSEQLTDRVLALPKLYSRNSPGFGLRGNTLTGKGKGDFMPSKLGPHFIGTPGFQRWLASAPHVFKFDPSSLGAAAQIPPGHLVVGKLDQLEENLNLTDWKHYMKAGLSAQATADHRFNVQRNIFVGPNKPRVDRYLVNHRIDVWEDDNEVVPDDPDEANWYADYCIAMMKHYQSIGKRRANFCFAVGTPDIKPGDPADIWPHLLPAVQHARDHDHFIALHEYMGFEADYGVGWNQVDSQRRPIRRWHGRTDAAGNPDESYPYGYGALRYRFIYDYYFRPMGLHDTPLLITECGCDSVESITPQGISVGTWTEQQAHWATSGKDPEHQYATMLQWYDSMLRQDTFVKGAMIFTVGSVGIWSKWDIAGTRAEEQILQHITSERDTSDSHAPEPISSVSVSITPPGGGEDQAEAAGFSPSIDLDRVAPGQVFQGTWVFRNSGSTTWDQTYQLVYVENPHPETAESNRLPLGAPPAQAITAIGAPPKVHPGEAANLTLTFKAPIKTDTYGTNWQLQGPDGRRFGPIRWMRLQVVGAAGSLQYELLGFQNTAGDFNNLQPGRQFTGTWSLRNTGSVPWTGDFRIVYRDQGTADTQQTARDPMGAKPVYSLRQVANRERVEPGDTVQISLELVAPLQTGAYAFHWQLETNQGESFGGTRWLRIGVVGELSGGTSKPIPVTKAVEFGMNINPEAHPLDIDRLAGLGWVRWVFWASRIQLSPEQAYQQRYRNLIQSYAAAGIRSLIILHQDTEWGNAPWSNGGWEQYAETFARASGRVAAVCSEFGDQVAYQIFNEQDSGPDNRSAIGIPAEHYALILDKAQAAIRQAHPGAKVILGGLNTGPDNAIRYARAVQTRLNGRLPVDALAVHPYGRYVKLALFNYSSIGKLSDSLERFKTAFPSTPLWITEIGVANDTPIGPQHYEDIGVYMREIVDEVAERFASQVPVLIWFAWTDLMRNSGILTADNKPKPHVYDAFLNMKARGQERLEALASAGLESFTSVTNVEFISFATTLENASAVPAGTIFTNRWRFKNTGITTWDDRYQLVFVPDGANSDPMVAVTSFPLTEVSTPATAQPGDEVEITLTLTAPEQFGRVYRSRWQLRDPAGAAFGHLYAEITVVPRATTGTGARTTGLTYLRDHTIPDGTLMVAGSNFHKQWAVRNSGSRHWGSGFRLVFIQGDVQMSQGVVAHIVPEARPGEEVILSISMTAPPARDGRSTPYSSLWRMQDDHGAFFGDPVWAKIISLPGTPIFGGEPVNDQGTALSRLKNDPSAWYSQLDSRWSQLRLGHGEQTIAAWGCLMTCMAMTLTAYGLRQNPAELNERLKGLDVSGFIGSNVQFIAPAVALPGLRQGINLRSFEAASIPFSEWTGEDPIRRIDKALASGYIVLAQVDTVPNNGLFDSNVEQHWVILLQRTPTGDDYLILDPVIPAEQIKDQPRSLMLKYGNRLPNKTNEENLIGAIKSTLVYFT